MILTGNAGTGKTAVAEAYCRAVGGVLPRTTPWPSSSRPASREGPLWSPRPDEPGGLLAAALEPVTARPSSVRTKACCGTRSQTVPTFGHRRCWKRLCGKEPQPRTGSQSLT